MKDLATDLLAIAGAGLLVWAAFILALWLGIASLGIMLLLTAAGLTRIDANDKPAG